MSTTDRFSPVFDLPRQDIRLDPSRFQGRQGEYSEDTVNAIVSGGRFDPTVSSLVVWKDPDSGQYFLLSGHSRFEAAKRLYESGKQPGLTSLPVKELLNATEEEAVEYATIESNRRGTEEGLVSDLKAYALAVSSGKNSTQLKRLFRPDSRLRKLQELSYLNPKGMFVEYLAQPSQQSFPYLERNARWVGDMRRQLPALTNAHERELFDYLYGSKKALNLDKSKFYDLVNNKVNRIDFDPDKALNLNDRISPTAYTDPINEQLRELDRDIDVAQKEIETRRSAIARARGEGIEVPKYQGRQTFEERIAELNAHIIRLIEKKEALRQASGKLERTMGGDLFSQVEEMPKPSGEILKPSGKQVIADPELLKQLHAYATIANGTGDKKMGAEINEVARFYEKNGYFDEDDRHTLLRYQEFISKGDNKLSSLLSLWQIVPVWGKYDAITKAKAVAHRLNGILPNEYRAEPRGASIIIKKGPAFFAELKLGAIEGEATGYKLNSKMERGDHIDIRVDFPNDSPDYNQQLTRHFMEYGLHQWGMPLNYRSCPPMRDGKPDITPNGLKSLQTCIVDEGDTANRHKDHSGHYTAERMRVHQAIVDEFRNQKPCITAPKKPIAVLTGGAPGSGKSHFLKGFAPWLNGNKVLHIDADEVRAKLPEYKGWNADNTHTETSHIVNMMLDSIGTPCKHDLVYDGTMNKAKKYLPLVDRLKKMGYEVLVIYMQVPKDVSMARVMERYQRTGRYVPQHVIDEVYANGLEAYEEVIKAADGYIRVDGVTGKILEKGGKPIPSEREYDDDEACCEGCAEKDGTPCEDTAKAKKIKLAKAFAFAAKARAKLLQLK